MTDRDLAKEIIAAGQKKEFDRLEEIVSQCDTKLVSRLRFASARLRNSCPFFVCFMSVGENGRRASWAGRCVNFLELFARRLQV